MKPFKSNSPTASIPSQSIPTPGLDQPSFAHDSVSANESSSPSSPVISSQNATQTQSQSPYQTQPQPCHPMITLTKSGIFKPKTFIIIKPMCEVYAITLSISKALTDSKWKQAIMDEYQAFMKNNTWELGLT